MKAEGEVLACSVGEEWQSMARLGCRVHCEEGGLKQRFYFINTVLQSGFIKTIFHSPQGSDVLVREVVNILE